MCSARSTGIGIATTSCGFWISAAATDRSDGRSPDVSRALAAGSVWDYGDDFERTDKNVRVVKTQDRSHIGRDFDLVVAGAVVEHLPDPKDALTTLFSLVADGGYFYARTPYMYPFLKHLKGMPLGYPGHLHDMGPQF